MKKFAIFAAVCCAAALSAGEHFWKLKDGTGSTTLKDESSEPIALQIQTPENVIWTREDDSGYFLNFTGGMATAPAAGLLYPKGFVLEVKFSADMRAKDARTWMPLVTCGVSYDKGYCVWINKDGRLLVTLPGTEKWYQAFRPGLRNRTEHELKVVTGDGRTQVIFDGRIVVDCKNPGEIKAQARTFYLGSTPSWKFFGNIYYVKIGDFTPDAFLSKEQQKKISGRIIDPNYSADEIVPVPGVADPAGTVLLADFTKFSPGMAIDGCPGGDKFVYRSNSGFFVPWNKGSLSSPADPDGAEPLSYDPKLTGKYDVYVGLRATGLKRISSLSSGTSASPTGCASPPLRPTAIPIPKCFLNGMWR